MHSDSGDVVYQITVLGYFKLATVRIRILVDGFAVMRQDKVIGLKLNVSIFAQMEDRDVALRRSPPSGFHNTRMVTKRPVLVRLRFHPPGGGRIPRLGETVCPPRYPRLCLSVSGKQAQGCMQDIDGSRLREAFFGSPTWVSCIWARELGCALRS